MAKKTTKKKVKKPPVPMTMFSQVSRDPDDIPGMKIVQKIRLSGRPLRPRISPTVEINPRWQNALASYGD